MTTARLRIASTPLDARAAIDWAMALVERSPARGRLDDVQMALAEVLNNVMLHAYRGRADGKIELELKASDVRAEIVVVDHGLPVPQHQFDEPPSRRVLGALSIEELPESGFGFEIIRSCADALQYQHLVDGNRTTLIFLSR